MVSYDEVIKLADKFMQNDYGINHVRSRQVKSIAKAIVAAINEELCNYEKGFPPHPRKKSVHPDSISVTDLKDLLEE